MRHNQEKNPTLAAKAAWKAGAEALIVSVASMVMIPKIPALFTNRASLRFLHQEIEIVFLI